MRIYTRKNWELKQKWKVPLLLCLKKTTIDVWNGYLLCSLQDYSSVKDSKQPANIITHDFEDLSEAASFVCTEQLRRRDLTNSFRKYLIGKKFSYEEALFHKKNLDTPTAKYRVAYKIGDEANISGERS